MAKPRGTLDASTDFVSYVHKVRDGAMAEWSGSLTLSREVAGSNPSNAATSAKQFCGIEKINLILPHFIISTK